MVELAAELATPVGPIHRGAAVAAEALITLSHGGRNVFVPVEPFPLAPPFAVRLYLIPSRVPVQKVMHSKAVFLFVPEADFDEPGRVLVGRHQAWGERANGFTRDQSVRQVFPAITDPAEVQPPTELRPLDLRVRPKPIINTKPCH